MAVTFTGGHQDFLTHIGVKSEFLLALKTLGGKLTLVSNTFKLTSSKYGLIGVLPHSTSSLLKMDKAGPSVEEARLLIENAIYKFVQSVDPHGVKVVLPLPKAAKSVLADVTVKPSAPKVQSVAAQAAVKPPLGPAPAFTQKPVPLPMGGIEKLADAGKMYQPVRGTSSGSVYSVVALSDSMKVAVRVGAEKVSIRVEGPCTTQPSAVKKLVEMGFAESKGTHFSMHLSCGNVPVERVIGAVLAGIGAEFVTPVPTLAKVKESCK